MQRTNGEAAAAKPLSGSPEDVALHQQAIQLLNQGQAVAALVLLEGLSQRQPQQADILDHLGAAHLMAGQHAAADMAFQACLALGDAYPETLNNAVRNARLGGYVELQWGYARRLMTLEGEPRLQGLLHGAEALSALKRDGDALLLCKQLQREMGDNSSLAHPLVRRLLSMRRPDDALGVCVAALQTTPQHPGLRMSRIEALLMQGKSSEGLALALQLTDDSPDLLEAMGPLMFLLLYQPELSVAERKVYALRYGAAIARQVTPLDHWPNDRQPDRPLRIGLLSGDLRAHPIGYFMASVLKALRGSSLQIRVYDTLGKEDEWSKRIAPYVEHWQVVTALSDKQLVALIRSDRIDVLADLHGHTIGNRLKAMAHKPAPVQFTYAGYIGSSGVPGIDYALADAYCVPEAVEPDAAQEFTEQVWRLPNSYYCYSPPSVEVVIGELPALRNGYITYGCLNRADKLNDRVLALWSRLLMSQPTARLLLRGSGLENRAQRERILKRFQDGGVAPERVTLLKPTSYQWYFQTFEQIDVVLDPFPYTGGTCTAEALWVGVPVLALKGEWMIWRMAESLLVNAGLGDWLAEDEDDFIALAHNKTSDLTALAQQRRLQRQQVEASPLMDAGRFAGEFEAALRQMWQRWCSGSE
jgi:protein O-GlcNAc transferase